MEALQRAVNDVLFQIATETLDALKERAFVGGKGGQAIDAAKAKIAEALHIPQDQEDEEEEDDLEKMLEAALEN